LLGRQKEMPENDPLDSFKLSGRCSYFPKDLVICLLGRQKEMPENDPPGSLKLSGRCSYFTKDLVIFTKV